MRGSTWCSQVLNPELANLSRMYCFILGRFSTVGGQGSFGLFVGGNERFGHWQGMSFGPTTPVLIHLARPATPDMEAEVFVSHCPTVGKL